MAEADLSEFKARLIYKANSRMARTVTQRNPVLKHQNTTTNNNEVFGNLKLKY